MSGWRSWPAHFPGFEQLEVGRQLLEAEIVEVLVRAGMGEFPQPPIGFHPQSALLGDPLKLADLPGSANDVIAHVFHI
jgi:hypothetical protein